MTNVNALSAANFGYLAGSVETTVRTMFSENNPDAMTEGVYIGMNACNGAEKGRRNVVVGANAGRRLRTGSDNILIGAYTETPASDTCNFVNIGNKLCFWRDTGEISPVPPPYVEGE